MPESIGLETPHFAENYDSLPDSRRSTAWERTGGVSRWAVATPRATPSPCRSVVVGPKEGHTLIGDDDRSGGMGVGGGLADGATHYSFLESDNHDHYGPGNGSNNNGTSRGQYTGPGH